MGSRKTPEWGNIVWGEREWTGSRPIYTGIQVSISLQSDYQKVEARYPYEGNLSFQLNLSSEYIRTHYHAGKLDIKITPSPIYNKIKPYLGSLSLQLSPTHDIRVSFKYDGSLALDLSPDSSIEALHSYSGSLTINFKIENILFAQYSGSLTASYSLSSDFEMVYAIWSYTGDLVTQLEFSSGYIFTYGISGALTIQPSLSSVYEKIEAVFSYTGTSTLELIPNYERTLSLVYRGSLGLDLSLNSDFTLSLHIQFFRDLYMNWNDILNVDKIKANDFYGTTHSSDLTFQEKRCAVCGEKFKEGDQVALKVKNVIDQNSLEDGSYLVPCHVRCEEEK